MHRCFVILFDEFWRSSRNSVKSQNHVHRYATLQCCIFDDFWRNWGNSAKFKNLSNFPRYATLQCCASLLWELWSLEEISEIHIHIHIHIYIHIHVLIHTHVKCAMNKMTTYKSRHWVLKSKFVAYLSLHKALASLFLEVSTEFQCFQTPLWKMKSFVCFPGSPLLTSWVYIHLWTDICFTHHRDAEFIIF